MVKSPAGAATNSGFQVECSLELKLYKEKFTNNQNTPERIYISFQAFTGIAIHRKMTFLASDALL